jgi:hypothetical protein
VTAILSNFLVKPKGGGKARGYAIGHATQQVDIFIAPTIRFTHSTGLLFVTDTTDTLFISRTTLTPVVDAGGAVLEYEFRIPLVAIATGEAYNVDPGLFAAYDRFNPYVTRVDIPARFSGGKGPETVPEILARAPTAISVRNLINPRSIDATLNDNFDGIEAIMVVGMGDPEMQRDLVPSTAPHLLFHVGGAVDIYLRTALTETSFIGTVGSLFARPDSVSLMFRDGATSFAGVLPGDIIRVTDGLPTVPAEFLVVENNGDTLVISDRAPFPVATDEALPATTVSYVIGRNRPTYNDVVSSGGQPLTTGITSRQVMTAGRITLPGGPIMDILDVALLSADAVEDSFRSTLDGLVHFPVQVNTTPDNTVSPAAGLQFQTVVHNPRFAQSGAQWMEVVVGTDIKPDRFDGRPLRVRYRTLASFASIDNFVRGTRERVSAAHQLPRGHHPVVVSMSILYALKTSATAPLNNAAIAQTIVDYINTFDTTSEAIDVSTVIQHVKNTYPSIANIVPPSVNAPLLTIFYTLRAPSGEVLSYRTTDVVNVDPAKQVDGPAQLTVEGQLLTLASMGVTGRTLRYISDISDVSARQVGF